MCLKNGSYIENACFLLCKTISLGGLCLYFVTSTCSIFKAEDTLRVQLHTVINKVCHCHCHWLVGLRRVARLPRRSHDDDVDDVYDDNIHIKTVTSLTSFFKFFSHFAVHFCFFLHA